MLGGTQSLHTNSMDEALALPSEEAVTVALRTQQVIAEESGVVNTVDPLAGSFYVEQMTNQIEAQVYDYWRQVDEMGGVLPAIDLGYYQQEISTAAYRYQREIDANERIIVGVNGYADPDEAMRIPILKMDPDGYNRQVARLEQLRLERDNEKVGHCHGRFARGVPGHREHDALYSRCRPSLCHFE